MNTRQPLPVNARDYLAPDERNVQVRWHTVMAGEESQQRAQIIVPHFVPPHLKGKRLKRFHKKHPGGLRVTWHPDHWLDRPDISIPGGQKAAKTLRAPLPYEQRPMRLWSLQIMKAAERRAHG